MVSQQGVHQQQNLHKLQGWKFETVEQYFSQKYFPNCKRAPHVIKENGHFLFLDLYILENMEGTFNIEGAQCVGSRI